MTGFADNARNRLDKVSRSGGIPVWIVIVVCVLVAYGAVELLDEIHLFRHIF